MSSWDIILIALSCLAIFRGYFKGLCRRLSDWVGLVLAAFLAGFNINRLDALFQNTFHVDGRDSLAEWLEAYFTARVASNPNNQLESLKQWVANLFLPSQMKESLYSTIDSSANEIYASIYNQVARVVANPAWDLVLFALGTILIFACLILIGELGGMLIRKLYFTLVLDRFLGAIISGCLMVVVAGVFTALCITVIPESAGTIGRLLHHSFMAPMLEDAVTAILKGGLIP